MNWQQNARSPALVVRPPAASLGEAHEAIDMWEHYSRKTLDEAQRLSVELMMAEAADGTWAARTTARCQSRQNGKGDELEVVEAWGLLQRGEWILHTAHEIPTSDAAHKRLVAFLDHKELARHVSKVRYANGKQSIEMRNGGTIVYRTRTAAGGRGLDDISRIVVDEAQHAQPEQLASSMPVLAVNPNPQVNFVGSAGIEIASEWWWTLRLRALTAVTDGGDAGEFSYLEHSAERLSLSPDGHVLSESPDPDDRDAWLAANTAHPSRISAEYLEEELRTLGPELFAREHLGVWDPYPNQGGGFLPLDSWDRLAVDDPGPMSSVTYGLAVTDFGDRAVIASAGRLNNGDLYIDVVAEGEGTDWIVDKALDLKRRKRFTLYVNPASAAGAFIRTLEDAGVTVEQTTNRQYQQACGEILDRVKNETIRHLSQNSLNYAIRVAQRRNIGHDGAWVWAEPSANKDIAPLKAATVAICGVTNSRPPRIHMLEAAT